MSIGAYDPWELKRFRAVETDKKPGLGKRIAEGWKKFGMAIAKVNLYALVFLIYWTVFAVTAVIAKVLGRDWLEIKSAGKELWHPLTEQPKSDESHYRQF